MHLDIYAFPIVQRVSEIQFFKASEAEAHSYQPSNAMWEPLSMYTVMAEVLGDLSPDLPRERAAPS
jgi:hypothetical protein